MVPENIIALRWLWDILSADVTIQSLVGTRVYQEPAPQSVVYPYILIQLYGADPDILSMGAYRQLSRMEVIVQGVDKDVTSDSTLIPIATRIDELLHRQGNEAVSGGGMILNSRRIAPHRMVDDFDTVQYRRLGGRYYLEVVPA